MKHLALTVLALLLFSQPVKAQSSGSLKVLIQNAYKDGIIGAQVAVYQGEKLVTRGFTDPLGLVCILNIGPGTYAIEVFSHGFIAERRAVEIHCNQISEIQLKLLVNKSDQTNSVVIDYCPEPIMAKYGGTLLFSSHEILRMPVR